MKYEDTSSSVNAYTVCTEEPLRCSTNEYTSIEDGYTDRQTNRTITRPQCSRNSWIKLCLCRKYVIHSSKDTWN